MIVEEIPAALAGERIDRSSRSSPRPAAPRRPRWSTPARSPSTARSATSGKVRVREGQVVAIDETQLPVPLRPPPTRRWTCRSCTPTTTSSSSTSRPGLVVHPGAGHPDGTLVNGLLARFPEIAGVGEPHRPGIVHRLDVGTSGLLVVARTPSGTPRWSRRSPPTGRADLPGAGVGHAGEPGGVIDAPIGSDHRDPTRMAVVVDGRPARTEYRVLRTYDRPVR